MSEVEQMTIDEAALRASLNALLDAFERAVETELPVGEIVIDELRQRGVELPPWLAML